jgi:UDP-glucuronate 4-epimerase
MSRILVTGAAGFIGFWTAKALAEKGHDVVGVDNFNDYYDPALKRARAALLKGACPVVRADVADGAAMAKVFSGRKFDKVCHLAAQAGVRYSLENPLAYESANGLGTLNLLELCRRKGVPVFVYASSSSVYGGNKKTPFSVTDRVDRPVSLYAATKRYNELQAHAYHHLYGLRCTGLRFFTVYGPWGRPDMAYFKFTKAILEGRPIDVYNRGRMRRDFTYVTDIVDGVLAALDKGYPCEIFNLGDARPAPLGRFIALLEKSLGRPAKKNLLPMQPGDVPVTAADISLSVRKLGFRPRVKLEEGIPLFTAWYRDHFKIGSLEM